MAQAPLQRRLLGSSPVCRRHKRAWRRGNRRRCRFRQNPASAPPGADLPTAVPGTARSGLHQHRAPVSVEAACADGTDTSK